MTTFKRSESIFLPLNGIYTKFRTSKGRTCYENQRHQVVSERPCRNPCLLFISAGLLNHHRPHIEVCNPVLNRARCRLGFHARSISRRSITALLDRARTTRSRCRRASGGVSLLSLFPASCPVAHAWEEDARVESDEEERGDEDES